MVVWSKVQMIGKWSSLQHCHPIISCFIKIQNGLPVWYQLTQVIRQFLLPPPKKEVMFLVRSVCLSVRRITRKLVNGF